MTLRATLLMTLLLGLTGSVWANRQPDGANDEVYKAYGQQLFTNLSGPTVAVLTLQNGVLTNASGIYWDSFHILTAGHVSVNSDQTNQVLGIILATNIYSSNRQTAGIVAVRVEPGWASTYSYTETNLDIEVLTLDKPINALRAVVGPLPGLDDVVANAGFGRNHSASQGDWPSGGFLRGWTSSVNDYGNALGTFSPNYLKLDFGRVYDGPLPGGGWHGDSGGGVYNSAGQVVGLSVFASGTGASGATYATRMDVAQPWIASVIAAEPPHIYGIVTTNNDVRLDWWAPGGTNYVVQAASGLGGTNAFTDLSAVIALPGSGTVTTNFVDAGALTNSPARFYRIRTP